MKTKDDITELRKELNYNSNIGYLTDNEDVLKALLDEAKETPKEPNLRLYMNDLKPDYNKDGQLTEKSYNEHLSRRKEFYNKVVEGYKFEDKYLYYDITNLKSIETIRQINKKIEHIKEYKDGKHFNPESLFSGVLNDLNLLPEHIAVDIIENLKSDVNIRYSLFNIMNSRYDVKNEDKAVYKDHTNLMTDLIYYLETNYKPQQHNTGTTKEDEAIKIEPKLTTPEAIRIFNRAIEAGYIIKEGDYMRWNFEESTNTKQLLAYFCEKMSHHLKMSDRQDKEGNETVRWKPFEILFDVENIKSAKNDWMKKYHIFRPNGYERIDTLFYQ